MKDWLIILGVYWLFAGWKHVKDKDLLEDGEQVDSVTIFLVGGLIEAVTFIFAIRAFLLRKKK